MHSLGKGPRCTEVGEAGMGAGGGADHLSQIRTRQCFLRRKETESQEPRCILEQVESIALRIQPLELPSRMVLSGKHPEAQSLSLSPHWPPKRRLEAAGKGPQGLVT